MPVGDGRLRGLAGLVQATQVPPAWRVPEGLVGLAAVPVGGGGAREHTRPMPRPIGGRRGACGAWPDNESTRPPKLAARAASRRAGPAAAGDQAGE